MMMGRLLTVCACLVFVAGCAGLAPIIPDRQVDAEIPGNLPFASSDDVSNALYWEAIVVDPQLADLVRQALDGNRDLRAAAANVAIAQANLNLTEAQVFPVIGIFGGASFGETLGGNDTVGSVSFADQASLGLGVSSWEVDLFDKLGSQNIAAQQSYFASEQGQRSAKIALVSAVINAYLQLAADQELLELSELSARSQQRTLDLVQQFRSAGTGSELEVRQASAILQSREAQSAQYRAAVQQDLNTLRFLVGGALPEDLLQNARLEPFPVDTAIETHADSSVLLKRPDVRAAEFMLLASDANIEAARAEYFPSISLSLNGGFASLELSDLFTGAGATGWSFAPSVSLPIFDGGRRDANFAGTIAQRDLAIANYEKAIQNAFRESADALTTAEYIEQQLQALTGFSEDTAYALTLSEERYEAGIDSYLLVLDTQRQDYSGRQQLIQSRLLKGQNVVALFKAMGEWPE